MNTRKINAIAIVILFIASSLFVMTGNVLAAVPTCSLVTPPTPANNTGGHVRMPTCKILVTGDFPLIINWYENSTGSWVHQQKNTSITSNTTSQWNFTQAHHSTTVYWWKVTIYDGLVNITRTYNFQLKPGLNVEFSPVEPTPANITGGYNRQPICKISITVGGPVTVNWYSGLAYGNWTHRQKNTSIATGATTQWNYSQANGFLTTYYWKVSVDDGQGTNVTRSYEFQTGPEVLPINVYVVPREEHIEVGNVSSIRLRATVNAGQWINGWGFESINFTQGIINVNRVKIGSHYTDDNYIFKDNETMHGHGTINNATGVIGGSWVDYYYEATLDSGVTNVNRTVFNLSITGVSPEIAAITIYSNNNQYFADSGSPVDFAFHGQNVTVHPQRPISFTATPGTSDVQLTWQKGGGATKTVVRGKLGSYPTSVTDGTWGVNTTAQMTNHTNLSAGQHWYYRAWSWNSHVAWSLVKTTADTTVTNGHAPTIYVVRPTNQSTVSRKPTCVIWGNDTNGGTMIVNFYENSTGAWIKRLRSYHASNDTFSWNFSQASAYGTRYWWKVTVFDGTMNTSKISWFNTVNSQTTPPYQFSVKDQWNMISVPAYIKKWDITVRYNGANYTWNQSVTNGYVLNTLFGWNTTHQYYVLADYLYPGQGYWMYSYYDLDLIVYDGYSNVIRQLDQNWSMVGLSCSNMTKSKYSLKIEYLGSTYTWNESVTNGYILTFLYEYDAVNQQYALTNNLVPGHGYWMWAYNHCKLKFQ
jgi:hypothetical protein